MRLSQANEDCQRASNHQSPSSDRSQAAIRLRHRFPKAVRLRTRQEFRRVQREGKRLQGQFLSFQMTSENLNCQKLGISVSKQFGSAVARNLFKRRVREIFRQERHSLPLGLKLHVAPRPGTTQPTLAQVKKEFSLVIDALKS